MRTYVCSFRLISTHCVTFNDCCCDDLWHRSGAGPAPDWRLRRRQHWAGGLHGGPVSPTGVVWGNDACDKASSEAGHSGAHYVLRQGTLCPPKADPRLLGLYSRPRGWSWMGMHWHCLVRNPLLIDYQHLCEIELQIISKILRSDYQNQFAL